MRQSGLSFPAKVVLVNTNRMTPPVAPLALDYLAHALEQRGIQADVMDLCFADDPVQDIVRYFARNAVAAVAVTFRNTDDTSLATAAFFVPQLKEITDGIRAETEAPIILGGAGFSVMPEAVMRYCGVDLGLWGEGELALPLMVSKLAKGEDVLDVPGVVSHRAGTFVRTPPVYVDLVRWGPPGRRAVDNARYHAEGGMGGIETKRGCPMGCVYCADPVGKGHKTRVRSPQSVVGEVEALLAQGVDHLHVCDSEFNIPAAHARAVCQELVARGLGDRVRWYTYASPAPFSESDAALWRAAGCVGVNFGVDSASDGILKTLGRHYTTDDLRQTAEICRRQGLVFMYDLLLGGPGETRDTLKQTIQTMKRLSPDRVGASLGVRIFPGTPLAAQVMGEGLLSDNPNLHGHVAGNDDFLAPVFYLSADLGSRPVEYLARLIGDDERFFIMDGGEADRSYNYNANTVLANAIRAGHRGAFWDILRRVG